jgi:23S rRNA (uridine2552-2'-O)-methyltransferase
MTEYEKPDFWALKAQREGYPARSVYKLQELDEKFNLVPRFNLRIRRDGGDIPDGKLSRFKVLDLGAAPGSWSLYVLRKMGSGGFLAAVDLIPLSGRYGGDLFRGDNFFFIRGDITSREVREALLVKGPYNLVISDAAPATTGNRQVDTLRSQALAEAALEYAESALRPGGNLAVKVFQGGDTPAVLKRIRELFRTGKSFKPRACRTGSFETYYLGLGKK